MMLSEAFKCKTCWESFLRPSDLDPQARHVSLACPHCGGRNIYRTEDSQWSGWINVDPEFLGPPRSREWRGWETCPMPPSSLPDPI